MRSRRHVAAVAASLFAATLGACAAEERGSETVAYLASAEGSGWNGRATFTPLADGEIRVEVRLVRAPPGWMRSAKGPLPTVIAHGTCDQYVARREINPVRNARSVTTIRSLKRLAGNRLVLAVEARDRRSTVSCGDIPRT